MEQAFLVRGCDNAELEWLQGALSPLAKVVNVGESLDELLRLIEHMRAGLVFIAVNRRDQVGQCTFIESLLETRSMVTVVAVGDGFDSELVIAAMRAGARDFITTGLRSSEVLGLVRRLSKRLPQPLPRSDQGSLTLLLSARPDSDAAFVATHLALAVAENDESTLLIDLGLPKGESQAILGVECSFGIEDALRNIRRLDTSVIESAFTRHESGLALLTLVEDGRSLELSTYAEIVLLLSILRQNFAHILVNVSGQPDGDVVRALAEYATRLLWYTDQGIPASQDNLALLERWRAENLRTAAAVLLLDRHCPKVAPDSRTLSQIFDLPLVATLPLKQELRLQCRNQGRSVFDLAPRDELSKKVLELSRQLLFSEQSPSHGWLSRWWRW